MRLALGSGYNDTGLVFPDLDGSPWAPDKFSSAFYYKMRALQLPEVSFHGLRHSFASIMHDAGASLKVMSEALGHTTIAVTANLSTHVLGNQQREAADRLGSAVESADARGRSLA